MRDAFHAIILNLAKTSFNVYKNCKRVFVFPVKHLKYTHIMMCSKYICSHDLKLNNCY